MGAPGQAVEGAAHQTVAQQQGATADSSGPPLSEQPPPRGNESLQNYYRYPESARAVLAEAAELRLLLNFDQWQCSSLP